MNLVSFLFATLEVKSKEVCEGGDGVVTGGDRSKAVFAEDEWDVGFAGSISIALCVSYIDCVGDMVAFHKEVNISSFELIRITPAFNVFEVSFQMMSFEESFDITTLAVADNVELISLLKFSKRSF